MLHALSAGFRVNFLSADRQLPVSPRGPAAMSRALPSAAMHAEIES